MEFMAVSSTPYDTDRFGAALPRFSPRQSDLLMVVGTLTHKQAPILLKVYEQMCEPKWVMAFGACATSGGFYQNYAAVAGIDKIIPVDVYVPGCPPRPETVIDAIMKLQDRIARSHHPILTETSDAWPHRRSMQTRASARLAADARPCRAACSCSTLAPAELLDAVRRLQGGARLRPLPRRHRGRLARAHAALRRRLPLLFHGALRARSR